jgi:hypothetical protein
VRQQLRDDALEHQPHGRWQITFLGLLLMLRYPLLVCCRRWRLRLHEALQVVAQHIQQRLERREEHLQRRVAAC